MVWGELKSYGVSVSRRRVRESLVRVNPTGVELRASTSVPCSNALWHIDGLHCLIRWRIVIHDDIDGYSRQVVYLGASNNNNSETVLQLFLEATKAYGWPSRVKSDCGGENIEVARCMTSTIRLLVQVFTTKGYRGCGETRFDAFVTFTTPCSMRWKRAIYCLPSAKLTCSAYIMCSFLVSMRS